MSQKIVDPSKLTVNSVFKCDHCGYCCHMRWRLNKHVREIHEHKYSCEFCSKTFGTSRDTQRHQAVCTESSLKETLYYSCVMCNHACVRLDNFLRHWRNKHPDISNVTGNQRFELVQNPKEGSPTPERPHICEICGKDYVRRSSLNVHMRAKH